MKLLTILLLAAATLSAQSNEMVTEHGYRFVHHIKKDGQKPKRGESIRAYVNIYVGDTLVSTSRKNPGGLYKFDIAPETANLDYYPPLMEASLLMGIGDSATIYQPLDTNMRKFVPKAVQNEKELRFEIRLLQIISIEEKQAMEKAQMARAAAIRDKVAATVKDYAGGNLKHPLTITKSGLKVLIQERGPGRPIRQGEAVQVHYYGFLTNGTSFDNSFERRTPLAFPAGVGQMIAGFDEGIMLLTHGSKAYFFIPGELGYGQEGGAGGQIPPNSELIYYVEVL